MSDFFAKPYIREVFEKALPILVPDFHVKKLMNRNSSISGNSANIGFSLDQYFNLTQQYDYHSNVVSHFTSIKSLFSILNSESIRLYNLLNVNDPNEFMNVLPEEFHPYLKRKKQDVYIMSCVDFETLPEADKLKMWKKYGDNSKGVRVELEVIPNHKAQYCFLKSICYDHLDTSEFFSVIGHIKEKHNLYELDVSEMLYTPSLLHKESKWKQEMETRLLFYDKDPKGFNADYPNPKTPIFWDYSNRYNTLCRYYNIKLNDPKSIALIKIRKIELGKFHNQVGNSPLFDELRIHQAIRKAKRIGAQFGVTISEI